VNGPRTCYRAKTTQDGRSNDCGHSWISRGPLEVPTSLPIPRPRQRLKGIIYSTQTPVFYKDCSWLHEHKTNGVSLNSVCIPTNLLHVPIHSVCDASAHSQQHTQNTHAIINGRKDQVRKKPHAHTHTKGTDVACFGEFCDTVRVKAVVWLET
jgi:hypothetical protein